MSTLNKTEREIERLMHSEFVAEGGEVFSFAIGVTVVMQEVFVGSKTVRVAVSVMSDTDIEFVREVGRYHALNRLQNDECLTVPMPANCGEFAEQLASMIVSC